MQFITYRSVKLFAAICLSFSLTVVTHAKPPRKAKEPPKVAYMAIASLDPKAMVIVIELKNSTATVSKTYHFTPQTRITVNGQNGAVSDLKTGQQIRVGTGPDEGVADELSASNPPADPKKPER